MSNYPEGLSARDYCYMEGCIGRGPCPRCGEVNYHLMGYYGAVALHAKRWGVTEDEAEKLIGEHQEARWNARVARRAAQWGISKEDAAERLGKVEDP